MHDSDWVFITKMTCSATVFCPLNIFPTIGPLQDPVTWYNITQYNITHAGEHRVALFCKSNCKIYLLTSMCVFVPFEQIMQRAIHWQHSDLWFT